MTTDSDPTRVAFVCVRNAGRSQMATGFAERERTARSLAESVAIVTGGTDPAEHVHDVVAQAMDEVGIDLADRVPRLITPEELESCDIVVTMGCSTLELGVGQTGIDIREWDLPDPGGQDLETVREIRETIHEHVLRLFDELEQEVHASA